MSIGLNLVWWRVLRVSFECFGLWVLMLSLRIILLICRLWLCWVCIVLIIFVLVFVISFDMWVSWFGWLGNGMWIVR